MWLLYLLLTPFAIFKGILDGIDSNKKNRR